MCEPPVCDGDPSSPRRITPVAAVFSPERSKQLKMGQLMARYREEPLMTKVAIILGSTRPGRNGEAVATWVYDIAAKRGDAQFELVDLADYDLPLLDEPVPPSMGQYSKDHTKRWAAKIAQFDAYVFVTAEYNHAIPGALKNAIDYLYAEWNNKAAGFVSYGSVGGTRAVEHLRLVMAELQVADVRAQVALSLFTDFEEFSRFTPGAQQEQAVTAMLDQVVAWGSALKAVRR
jgi:NAD(P)H-dependent FMN reductase